MSKVLETKTEFTQQQIEMLSASFYPVIKAYFESEEGKAEYQKYLDKKADSARLANDSNDNSAILRVGIDFLGLLR